MSWVVDVIKKISSEKFYGKIILQFEAGKIVLIRKEETIKPPRTEP